MSRAAVRSTRGWRSKPRRQWRDRPVRTTAKHWQTLQLRQHAEPSARALTTIGDRRHRYAGPRDARQHPAGQIRMVRPILDSLMGDASGWWVRLEAFDTLGLANVGNDCRHVVWT